MNNLLLNDFCFIVPTKDRIDLLNRLLISIYAQNYLPKYIIIVDGSSEECLKKIMKNNNVKIIYESVYPPSLTKQRNVGISLVPECIKYVGFLDDDLVLLKNSIQIIYDFYSVDIENKYGGISFNLLNEPKYKKSILKKLFYIGGNKPGKISISGTTSCYNNPDEECLQTEWLCGGATVWRKEVFEKFKFDEWYKGYALWEDVDFSFRVSGAYTLAVLKRAEGLHLHIKATLGKDFYLRCGDIEVVDRLYFVKKYPDEFSFSLSLWSCFGTFIGNFMRSIIYGNILNLLRSYSNIKAIIRCFFGNIERGI